MSSKRITFVQERERLLVEITESLRKDERFVAAWLAGSYGRGEQTWQSDLDIHVVVVEEHSGVLCATPWPSGARTTPERLALFSQFGTPAIIFDAHSNNLMGGTFTYVAYQEAGHNVDWMLIPQAKAYQEHPCRLLF
ncbi:MAG: nucleotidyltransferase domain-containing protein, partial [Ktedonobacteraceae bacterium]